MSAAEGFPVGTAVVYTQGRPITEGEVTERWERCTVISEPFEDEPELYQWVASWPKGIASQPDVSPELIGDLQLDPRATPAVEVDELIAMADRLDVVVTAPGTERAVGHANQIALARAAQTLRMLAGTA